MQLCWLLCITAALGSGSTFTGDGQPLLNFTRICFLLLLLIDVAFVGCYLFICGGACSFGPQFLLVAIFWGLC